MRLLLLPAIFLVLSPTSRANEPTCAEIEKVRDSEGNIAFFRRVEGPSMESRRVQEVQTRIAVQDFYGLCQGPVSESEDCYRPSMSLEQVDRLGEGVVQYDVRSRVGGLYRMVNVGFGGGNGASYFFPINSLRLLPWMIIDGSECGPLHLGQRPWSR